VLSAHRTPDEVVAYVRDAEKRGVKVFIGAAGGAAHLAGVIAAHTTMPVLAIPITSKLDGLDSLLSMVQMPKGIPVGCLAIGEAGAANAGILAVQILSTSDAALAQKLKDARKAEAERILKETLSRAGCSDTFANPCERNRSRRASARTRSSIIPTRRSPSSTSRSPTSRRKARASPSWASRHRGSRPCPTRIPSTRS
jgi:5-(carboxyamino)imidazole ribonucleotide mutase